MTEFKTIGEAEQAAAEATSARYGGDLTDDQCASLALRVREAEKYIWWQGHLARSIQRYRDECHPDRRYDAAAFWQWAERSGLREDVQRALGVGGNQDLDLIQLRAIHREAEATLRRLDIDAVQSEYAAYEARKDAATEREWADVREVMATRRGELEAIAVMLPEKLSNEQRALLRRYGQSLRITKEIEDIEALPEERRNDEQRRQLRLMGSYFLPRRTV